MLKADSPLHPAQPTTQSVPYLWRRQARKIPERAFPFADDSLLIAMRARPVNLPVISIGCENLSMTLFLPALDCKITLGIGVSGQRDDCSDELGKCSRRAGLRRDGPFAVEVMLGVGDIHC